MQLNVSRERLLYSQVNYRGKQLDVEDCLGHLGPFLFRVLVTKYLTEFADFIRI